MEQPKLSEGSLKSIMEGSVIENPVVQILACKKIIASGTDTERYRILLSDGKHTVSFAMLTTQTDRSAEVVANTIIKLTRYVTSKINNSGKKNRRALVVTDMEVLVPGDKVNGKIGNPEQLPESDETEQNGNAMTQIVPKPVVSQPPQNNNADQSLPLYNQLTFPISSLSPYQNKWVIKARVSAKTPIRSWSNSRGEGKLFSVDFLDESGEIRATIFRDLVDKFYNILEVDKVYYLSKCQLKMANKQFSRVNNEYEMTFTNETLVQECHDEIMSIPQVQYKFITIDQLANMEVGAFVDVVGVCKSASDLSVFQARTTGRELKKREVTLVDQSNSAVALTIWGAEAESFNGSGQPVLVIKAAKIGEFGGGKNLSLHSGSVMKMNPDLPESHRLRGWFDNGGMQMEVSNISARSTGGLQTPWMSFQQVQDENFGTSERGDYYQVMATILMVKNENLIYKSCPTEDCKKKVQDLENGIYRCEKCNRESPNFNYRLLANLNVADWSGNQWISMFSAEAEKVLEMTAKELGEAAEKNKEAVNNTTNKCLFKPIMIKCRAKMETYNDEKRLKTVAVKVESVDYKQYNAHLISRIEELIN